MSAGSLFAKQRGDGFLLSSYAYTYIPLTLNRALCCKSNLHLRIN